MQFEPLTILELLLSGSHISTSSIHPSLHEFQSLFCHQQHLLPSPSSSVTSFPFHFCIWFATGSWIILTNICEFLFQLLWHLSILKVKLTVSAHFSYSLISGGEKWGKSQTINGTFRENRNHSFSHERLIQSSLNTNISIITISSSWCISTHRGVLSVQSFSSRLLDFTHHSSHHHSHFDYYRKLCKHYYHVIWWSSVSCSLLCSGG